MKNIWTIAELDPSKLFEVIRNRDPETSMRFSLPIPNWLDEAGGMKFEHPQIADVPQKGKRFGFHNGEDDCYQYAKIDGNGVIIFTSPTPGQVIALRSIIQEYAENVANLKPEDVHNIMLRAYDELGIMDVFNGNRDEIVSGMDLIGQQDVDPAYGSFVYKPDVSSCIFLAGNGEFLDGPAATPQIIENGGFVTFSGQSKENVAAFIEETITGNVSKKLKGKIVSKVQFLKSRRLANGHPISLSKIPVQEAPLKRIYTPKPISGFPEWTPEIRDIERQWLEAVAEIFERYGFVNIETPAAEEIAVLADKGEEIERDVYEMKRMNAEDDKDPKIALHYDLTVPMARYVAQHYNELSFPFKRYQIQKVWRGSRPQKGKFREFIQCDIDVVDHCPLSMEFDADFPVILYNLVKRLDIGNIAISVNNRKILEGFYRGLGIDDPQILRAIHVVDKIQKVGEEGVRARLSEELGLSTPKISKCIALAEIRSTDACIKDRVMELGIDTPLLREGIKELDFVMNRLRCLPEGAVVADLSIARGFDYYTGTVYEGRFVDYPDHPPILVGGRYDNLVGKFMEQQLPGVGISLELTSIFTKLVKEGQIQPGRKTPTQALVAMPDMSSREIARQIADQLRERGLSVEVYHEPIDIDKQKAYAIEKGIPYLITPSAGNTREHCVRDMRSGIQKKIPSLRHWQPN